MSQNQDSQDNGKGNNPAKKRYRRTKIGIEKLFFDAATKIIEKHGLTVTGIAHVATIEPPVFYNRYKDIEDFIEKYVRNYDYWLRDTINFISRSNNPLENMEIILNGLIDSLAENIPMQKLIAWEMNENNQYGQPFT
jgi:AcrR family transcriptional regulator